MADVYSADALIASYEEIRKPIRYKNSVQEYGMNLLTNVSQTIRAHEEGTLEFHKGAEFTISERGKVRHITPVPFPERVPIHAFCNQILIPEIRPYLIYDNCASLKGRGIDMQRDRLAAHLHKYYMQYHTNKGYILFGDFSKYFDNIDHAVLIRELSRIFTDEEILDEVKRILKVYRIDGSIMTDEEFRECTEGVYDSRKFYNRKEKIAPERYIEKSEGIGSEMSQITGVYLPTRIDNYVKIVRGCKYYGRYNDDFYLIHPDKEFLEDVFKGIMIIADELKVHLNLKKTRIVALDRPFIFLKIKYTLTDTGKVVRSFTAQTFTRERRKLKKYRRMLDTGELDYKTIEQQYRSWRGHVARKKNKNSKNGKPIYSNWKSLQQMDKLYKELFITPFLKGEEHGTTEQYQQ